MCTSVIVGEKATADGSFLLARSADSSALKAQHFVIHEAREWPEGSMYRTQDHKGATAFEWPQPAHSMRFTTVPNWQTQLHGAVGFNEAGVGLTGTESIFARDDALAIDPYNKASGITEDDIPDVLLSRCTTAREACALLGRIIEEAGCGEGFGVGFVDSKEVWYLETGTGHQWIAHRTPADKYMATGNQGRLREYDPEREDMMGSPTVMSWAKEHGFWNPEEGPFDFAATYTRNDERDRVYNDPRVWIMQKHLNPSVEQPVDDGRNFEVYLTPEKPITVDDLKALMRNHYDMSEHDPYQFGLRGDEPWRPISVFRTYESHIMQVRPWLPQAIGCLIHLAFGMADLSAVLPGPRGRSPTLRLRHGPLRPPFRLLEVPQASDARHDRLRRPRPDGQDRLRQVRGRPRPAHGRLRSRVRQASCRRRKGRREAPQRLQSPCSRRRRRALRNASRRLLHEAHDRHPGGRVLPQPQGQGLITGLAGLFPPFLS